MIRVEDIKRLEKLSNEFGVSNSMLMERAGKSLYEYLSSHLELKTKTAVIFAGQGNNAGDGFVLARHLSKDCFVFVFLYGDESKFTGEASSAFSRIQGNDHIEILRPHQLDTHTVQKIKTTDHLLVIDALLGTGITGEMDMPYTGAIDLFNSMRGNKVSVDIPSGVDPETGQHATFVCKPDLVLTLYDKKHGLMGVKNVVIVPLQFAPEAIEKVRQEQGKRGPFSS